MIKLVLGLVVVLVVLAVLAELQDRWERAHDSTPWIPKS